MLVRDPPWSLSCPDRWPEMGHRIVEDPRMYTEACRSRGMRNQLKVQQNYWASVYFRWETLHGFIFAFCRTDLSGAHARPAAGGRKGDRSCGLCDGRVSSLSSVWQCASGPSAHPSATPSLCASAGVGCPSPGLGRSRWVVLGWVL